MKRDSGTIQKKLKVIDGKVYTSEKTIIEFPSWYQDKKFVSIEDVNYIYGIFAIIIGDSYSISRIPTMIPTVPIMVNEVDRDGETYIQYVYGKDDCIIENTTIVQNKLLSYTYFEAFFMYARIPWFVDYEDLLYITDNLVKYAGSEVGGNFIANELLTSFVTRVKENKEVFYRQKQKGEYSYIDLMNVYYSALNTVSRIGGNRFNDSIVSALVQKETSPTQLENIVRK